MSDETIDEAVLTVAQRMKRGQIMRRNQNKLKRARELARKRPANTDKLKQRALRAARDIVRSRYAGKAGGHYGDLSDAQKIAIDKAIEGKQKLIQRLADRLLPKIKQKDYKRLQSYMKGDPIQNHGAPEGHMNEAFKDKFKNVIILNRLDDKAKSAIAKKAEKADLPEETLLEVYNRGLDDWTSDTQLTREQYAFSRVNSFVNKGQSYYEDDNDLVEQESIEEQADPRIGDISKVLVEQRQYKVDVHLVTKSGEHKTDRETITAPNSQVAQRKVKEIKSRYPGAKANGTSLVENYDPTKAKKYQRIYFKVQNKPNHPTAGTIHSIGKTHTVVRANGGLFKTPHSTLTTDINQWVLSKKYKDVNEDVETLDEISQKTKDSYRISANLDKTIAKTTLDHDQKSGDKSQFTKDEIARNKNILRKRTAGLKRLGEDCVDDLKKKEPTPDTLKIKHNKQEIIRKIIEGVGNSETNPLKRLVGTDSATKAYKKDTPGELSEDLRKIKNEHPLGSIRYVKYNTIADVKSNEYGDKKLKMKVSGHIKDKQKRHYIELRPHADNHFSNPNTSHWVKPENIIKESFDELSESVEDVFRKHDLPASVSYKSKLDESFKPGKKITVLSHSKGGRDISGEIIGKHDEKPEHYVVKTKNAFGGETKLVIHKSMLKEAVKTAEKEPVVVPSFTDQYGNVIPSKTVMRKKGKVILKTGNVHDGEKN